MPAYLKQMIKVKCIGSIMSLNYFMGETYEISQKILDAYPTCFQVIKPDGKITITVEETGAEENKMMGAGDVMTKADMTGTNENTETETVNEEVSGISDDVDPDYENMSYQDLKAEADKRGIEYKHNISKVDLIAELLKC
jgi:hypothetical protein